jgi:predicted signal transduction protein with EAL and GGDEF domain
MAFGWTSVSTAAWFSAFMVAGNLGFLVTIRSSWNRRFAEPAVTFLQMLFALVSLGLAYAINLPVRGALLPLMGLLVGELSKLRNAQKQQKRDLRAALRRLREVALQDTLTGRPNRRRVQKWFAQETERSRRTRAPQSVALSDIDHFKRVNDDFGHATGGEVLRRIAHEAGTLLRISDLLAC